MTREYFFVDGSRSSREEKRAMRRHVMVGKNAGKTIHRRSRLGLLTTPRPLRNSDINSDRPQKAVVDLEDDLQPRHPRVGGEPAVSRVLGDDYSSLPCPVEVSTDARQIIEHFFELTSLRLYPVKIGVPLDDAKHGWLELLFSDEAIYHCNLALMQACNEMFLYKGANSSQALYHLGQTLARVRRRLGEDDALSDGTIAIVMSLVIQEQVRGQRQDAAVHFLGLQRMIALRGGLSQLDENSELVLKACKIDITLALEFGRRPVYFRDRMADVRTSLTSSRGRQVQFTEQQISHFPGKDPDLNAIQAHMMFLCTLVNSEGTKLGICPFDLRSFSEINVSLWCRILSFRTLNEVLESPVDDTSLEHFGMILFMMTIFLYNDRQQIVDYVVVRRCIEHVRAGLSEELDCKASMWFLLLSLMWMEGRTCCALLQESLRSVTSRRDVEVWTSVRTAISGLPWIDALHEEAGRSIWRRLFEHE